MRTTKARKMKARRVMTARMNKKEPQTRAGLDDLDPGWNPKLNLGSFLRLQVLWSYLRMVGGARKVHAFARREYAVVITYIKTKCQ
jgi:hypothetical protein